jgi:hypothetical protein
MEIAGYTTGDQRSVLSHFHTQKCGDKALQYSKNEAVQGKGKFTV